MLDLRGDCIRTFSCAAGRADGPGRLDSRNHVPSSVPFAGGVLVAGLAISMTATGALFPELARAVASLEACIRGLAGPSPGAEVAIVIGYVVLAFAIVTTGAVGNQSPFGAKKG